MAVNKPQKVSVELVAAVLCWRCPSCNNENERTLKRSAYAVNELYCDHCDCIIEKNGEIYWTLK
jgi:hypothetical protein